MKTLPVEPLPGRQLLMEQIAAKLATDPWAGQVSWQLDLGSQFGVMFFKGTMDTQHNCTLKNNLEGRGPFLSLESKGWMEK